jgi:dTDP-4-amino-4,6-dideoxygalactose transaminase
LLQIEEIGRTRDQVMQELTDLNIGTGVHYRAIHIHPYYAKTYGLKRGDFPEAEFISERTLSIPLSAKLTDEDVTSVIAALRYVLRK